MHDFTKLSDEQIVEFVDEHFHLFASKKDERFPTNVLDMLPRGKIIIPRDKDGFAIAFKGRLFPSGIGHVNADLMFLYVKPEFENQGIGSQLIEQVKASVPPGVPIILTCEGKVRMHFFEQRGFAIDKDRSSENLYFMCWVPPLTTTHNSK